MNRQHQLEKIFNLFPLLSLKSIISNFLSKYRVFLLHSEKVVLLTFYELEFILNSEFNQAERLPLGFRGDSFQGWPVTSQRCTELPSYLFLENRMQSKTSPYFEPCPGF